MWKCYPLALSNHFVLRPSTLRTVASRLWLELKIVHHSISPTMRCPIIPTRQKLRVNHSTPHTWESGYILRVPLVGSTVKWQNGTAVLKRISRMSRGVVAILNSKRWVIDHHIGDPMNQNLLDVRICLKGVDQLTILSMEYIHSHPDMWLCWRKPPL